MTRWNTFKATWNTLRSGLALTFRHFLASRHSRKEISISQAGYFNQHEGIATIQYPHERIAVPETGRYRLHNEIDDCIVCDKCAKVCPVNCITIDPVRSPEEFGKTSDGTPKRIYAAKFDIDMAKCCFCGLCTTVCPTECLTMTPEYDYSTLDIQEHNFSFSNMTAVEIDLRKKQWEAHTAAKPASTGTASATPRPVIKPIVPPPSAPAS